MQLHRHEQRLESPPPASSAHLAHHNPVLRRFVVVPAHSVEQVRLAQRLRYQVYCVEHPFEDPACFPEGLEHDGYDGNAIHSLLYDRECAALAGTVRLILPRPDTPCRTLPIQRLCRHPLVHDQYRLRLGSAEISRFAISKEYRSLTREQRRDGSGHPSLPDDGHLSGAVLALIRGIVQMSREHGISELFAVMEPALLRLLERFGIRFHHLGPLVEYHGRRQPCYANRDELVEQLRRERPDIWQLIIPPAGHQGTA